MEKKFHDPLMVLNRLAIIVASNSDWAIPAGIRDRRWSVLNVKDTYAGTTHKSYWDAFYRQMDDEGGKAAMLHDLLAMDLSRFDVRAVPATTAKAQKQAHSFRGTVAWLHEVLQDGAIGHGRWSLTGLIDRTDHAYDEYVEFSKKQREYHPETKNTWAKTVRKALGPCVKDTRPTVNGDRVRSFEFAPLDVCRRQFADHVGAHDLDWEETDEGPTDRGPPQTDAGVGEGMTIDDILYDLNCRSPGWPDHSVH